MGYDTTHLHSLLPRNTRGYYPMYGCVEDQNDSPEEAVPPLTTVSKPPLLAWAIVDPRNELRSDVVNTIGALASRLADRLPVGGGLRMPYNPSASCVQRLLPLLCPGIVPLPIPASWHLKGTARQVTVVAALTPWVPRSSI